MRPKLHHPALLLIAALVASIGAGCGSGTEDSGGAAPAEGKGGKGGGVALTLDRRTVFLTGETDTDEIAIVNSGSDPVTLARVEVKDKTNFRTPESCQGVELRVKGLRCSQKVECLTSGKSTDFVVVPKPFVSTYKVELKC